MSSWPGNAVFSFRKQRDGTVRIAWQGKVVTTLRGKMRRASWREPTGER